MHTRLQRIILIIGLLSLSGFVLSAIGARAAEPPATVPPNIVGGTPVNPGDYPWLAGLLVASVQEEAAVFCGGALIDDGAPAASSQWVLTAAHCLVVGGGVVSPAAIEVLAGQYDLTQVQPEQRHPVADIIVHPLYLSGYAPVNDIALLRLAAPVNVGNTLPVATPADAAFFAPGADAQIAGWGNLLPQTGVQQPDVAHKAVVKIVDQAQCNERYDQALGIEHLCAGIMPAGGVDTCQGDSGGPLMVQKGSTLIHAGIVSFGQGCGWPHFPGVYARTATYADWINAVINDQPHVGITQSGPYAIFQPDTETPPTIYSHISTAAPGEPFTYTLQVANTGMQVLDTLTITATLPGGASLIAINDGGIVADPVITWTATDLAPGEVIERSYVVSATASVTTGPYGVTAISGSTTVTASGQPLTTLVNEPRLHLFTGETPSTEVGSVFEQSFLLINFGRGSGASVDEVDVRVALPANADVMAISNEGTVDSGEARWRIVDLEAEQFVEFGTLLRARAVGDVIRITDYRAQIGSATPTLGATASQTVVTEARRYFPFIAR